MAKVWLMKPSHDQYESFIQGSFIGIDDTGVDDWYTRLNSRQIKTIFGNFPQAKTTINAYEKFARSMARGDIVILGLGQLTEYNIMAVGVVTSDYRFEADRPVRHIRDAVLKALPQPLAHPEWSSAGRIQELPPKRLSEFAEVMASVLLGSDLTL